MNLAPQAKRQERRCLTRKRAGTMLFYLSDSVQPQISGVGQYYSSFGINSADGTDTAIHLSNVFSLSSSVCCSVQVVIYDGKEPQ